MTVLYFDCVSGAAGDMILAALLDAGASEPYVREQLATLRIEGWELTTSPVMRAGIRSLHVEVSVSRDQSSRTFRDIAALLEESALDEPVRRRALAAFEALARAEGRVHDMPPGEVHFHEVGAIDAIVDIVGGCAALESLGPRRVVTSPLPLGGGTARSAHGEIPIPAPAVLELVRGVPVAGGGDTELVTPTGAALLTTWTDKFGDLPPMTLVATGYGAGTRDLERPNVLRVLVGDETVARADAEIIEANIDDMAPEIAPYVIEKLLAAGAHDAWVTPALMKKGRVAFTLSVLGRPEDRDRLCAVLFAETTTFGVRFYGVEREMLEREWHAVDVAGQPVRVKIGRRGGHIETLSPEYEDARAAAEATGMPLKEIYAVALERARAEQREKDSGPAS